MFLYTIKILLPLNAMKFDILTLFPETITSYINTGVIGRAQNTKQVLSINVHNIRDYTTNPHKKVDDTPFGGGAGMIVQLDPVYRTLMKILKDNPDTKKHIIFFKAGASLFNQSKAISYAQDFNHIIFICGRYEGIDHRVEQYLSNESLSIGPYVLTGGELPALIVLDAVSRYVPEVLGNKESIKEESWLNGTTNEYPQYSRPRSFQPEDPHIVDATAPNQWDVPEVLLSGDHAAIQKWRNEHSS